MPLSFTNLFTRIGAIGGLLNATNTYRGTTVPAKVAALDALYSSEPSVSDGIYATLASLQAAPAGFLAALKALAVQTVVNDVDAATPLPDASVGTALASLVAQMRAASQSVSQSAVSASVAAGGSNSGNPSILASVRAASGYQADNAFAEAVAVTVAGDAQSGTATAGQEPLRFRGLPAASGPLGWDYPAGSGCNATANCVDAAQSAQGGSGQWLTNGNFEAWSGTPLLPAGWHCPTGSSQVARATSGVYDGAAALTYIGDGSTLTALTQGFGVDTGPTVLPGTQYCFNLWAKVSSVPAAGVLEVALVDGSGTVLVDGAGNNAAVTFSLPGLTTSYAPLGGFLRTPRVLPAATSLRVRLSTALSAGSTLFLDRMSYTRPVSLYQQGPYVAAFSGSAPAVIGDTFTLTVANNYGGKMQQLFDRLFGMKSLGLLLPTGGSPTQADSLIA